ncbi:hypothetical protein VNI00_019217 [Paramarasmius palmivorus]|uniref:Uncharacterized protein n=1 Tax=Paramarasmius palmivorus TaxID=297713 RepID=A0AAW0APD2_9AGAR
MGGFALYNGDDFLGILWDHDSFENDRETFRDRMPLLKDAGIIVPQTDSEEGKRDESFETDQNTGSPLQKHGDSDSSSQLTELEGVSGMALAESKESENQDDMETPILRHNDSSSVEDKSATNATVSAAQIELSTCLLEHFAANGYIDITENEVMAKGSGDALSKCIAIIQVTWFIIQVIARFANELTITEVEVITLAYTSLLGVSYYFWWDKPLRVRYVVRVTLRKECSGQYPAVLKPSIFKRFWIILCEGFPSTWEYMLSYVEDAIEDRDSRPFWARLSNISRPKSRRDRPRQKKFPFIVYPYIPLIFPLRCVVDSIYIPYRQGSLFGNGVQPSTVEPRFSRRGIILLFMSSLLFAAIHFFTWDATFPTDNDRTKWQLSSIVLASAPILFGVASAISHAADSERRNIFLLWFGAVIVHNVTVWVYVCARITTIYIALKAFHSLPYSSLQAVRWTQFIPHFG